MALFIKINDFVEQVALAIHDFDTHTFKLALTNTAPTPATDVSWLPGTTAIPPAAVGGYTTGGNVIAVTVSETGGIVEVRGNETVFTATAAGIGPFRYALLYNDTATTPIDALIGYWDYGVSITLADTETFTATFNSTPTAGKIFEIN